jgi:1,4-alpha-glucan branching enzyme
LSSIDLGGAPPADLAAALRAGELATPHDFLGPHAVHAPEPGVIVRCWHPDAVGATWLPAHAAPRRMHVEAPGLFSVFLAGRRRAPRYEVSFAFANGEAWTHGDPYRFAPTVAAPDLDLFAAGEHLRLWRVLGAHPCRHGGVAGTRFAVWAPHARAVRLVGDFCAWDGRLFPMRVLGTSGVWELFVPGLGPGALYKFEILTRERQLRLKSDPFGNEMQPAPHAASRISPPSQHRFGDRKWMARRRRADPTRAPLAIYEVHLGSWREDPQDRERCLSYRELAPQLIAHAKRFGFTHLELLPIAEHAFYASWGYQITGYYAPTWRYGTPDDLRWFVDECHREGLGVILDWVPAHFPKDDFALRRFDGPPLFEVEDPQQAEHPDWGTLMFDFGRPQVCDFLIANALYWLREYHVDGLRVDAVSWLLYLDYGRREGEWKPNREGGREHLDGIAMLRRLHRVLREEAPGAITIAEEATAWPGVTAPIDSGGLGFTFKWNMGWMNDTLAYFALDPIMRKGSHDKLTFAMHYESRERFVNPLSHDEVVHLKRSLLGKMPGDAPQKLANLRVLLAYQWTRPGKKLLFMGAELASDREWDHDGALPWHLWDDPGHRGVATLLEDLGALYASHSCLWRRDPDRESFAWIDGSDADRSVISYARRDGVRHLVVVLNLTPVPRPGYRIGVPGAGRYTALLSTDAARYGGTGQPTPDLHTEDVECWGWTRSVRVDLPPLAALVLAPVAVRKVQEPPPGAIPE